MALARLELVCAAGQQPHHPVLAASVEARTLRKARLIAGRFLGWRWRKGLGWCRDCWALAHRAG